MVYQRPKGTGLVAGALCRGGVGQWACRLGVWWWLAGLLLVAVVLSDPVVLERLLECPDRAIHILLRQNSAHLWAYPLQCSERFRGRIVQFAHSAAWS